MAERYGILEGESQNKLLYIELARILHRGKGIVVARRIGPNWYPENVEVMRGHYSNSSQFPDVTLRPATPSESISIALGRLPDGTTLFGSKGRGDMKEEVFNEGCFQGGIIVKAQDGVYINPLTAITVDGVDERVLKELRDKTKSFGRGGEAIRLGANDFAFVPYESFEPGVQSAGDFVEGGLARGLEHVEGDRAPNLEYMASTYRDGVNVLNFNECREPLAEVFVLESGEYDGRGGLHVGCHRSGFFDGYASGVVVTSDEVAKSTPKN
jgi:hypothetical protein